jgi:RHH-type rel operon transcriptional repressor/antitoxin RelB
MHGSHVVTIHLEPSVKEKLEQIARATAQTKSFLIADAIQDYLAINEWQVKAIEEGIKQAEAGKLVPHEVIRKKWEAKRSGIL